MLKPQDIVVALKIAALAGEPWTYSSLAASLAMSASGVHESVHRATKVGLLSRDGHRPVRAALVEFLVHGMKYVFPAERGPVTRGMPTATAALPLSAQLTHDDALPLVWPDRNGARRGESLAPLYASAPTAAAQDAKLYAFLAVVDALRVGTAREREVAGAELRRLLAA